MQEAAVTMPPSASSPSKRSLSQANLHPELSPKKKRKGEDKKRKTVTFYFG